jgi:hypothetical protein
MKASEWLRGTISDFALERLDRLGIERDLELAGMPELLRRGLEERGWPVHQSAFAFDQAVGGIRLAQYPFGVFSALVRRKRSPAPRDDELLRYEGRVLLPADGANITSFWIDEDGIVYEGCWGDYDPEGEDYCAPAYASYRIMIERFVLQRGPREPDAVALRDPRLCHTLHVRASLGEGIASSLGLELWQPASDQFARVWRGDAAMLMEHVNPSFDPGTVAYLETFDQVVAACQVIAAEAPDAHVRWHGPLPEPPRPGDPLVLRQQLSFGRFSEMAVYGSPGAYRVEVR